MAPKVCAAAPRWAVLGCRRARRYAPRFGPAPKAAAGNAVPISDELSGALPPPPVLKAALVTGAARRIGRALSLALAESGFAVAVHHHRSKTEAEAVVAEIDKAGGKAVALA